jgi:hypothetical protein
VQILANVSDVDSPVWASFANEASRRDWADCCHAAANCCQRMIDLATQPESSNNKNDSSPVQTTDQQSEGRCYVGRSLQFLATWPV